MGGMVLETNMTEILTHVDAQTKLEKSEATATATIRVSDTPDMWVAPRPAKLSGRRPSGP